MYVAAIRIYALFNAKAAKWIAGRKDWQHTIKDALQPGEKRIWVHTSSVGEYEQAKPVIEALRKQYPQYKILVTFFSPSGYEACKNSPLADYVFYLPHDSKGNAAAFIGLTEPTMALFVKYEFWYHYLTTLQQQGIPTLLVSGAFRPGQPFFAWYGGLFRKMLECFSYFFLQDEESVQCLAGIGVDQHLVVSGDTRYDRVAEIAAHAAPISAMELYKGNSKLLIAGSTWPGDEALLKDCMSILPGDWKLVIVPHEIDAAHIRKVQGLFGNEAVLFTELDAEHTGRDEKVLIVNNMGMLARMFAYADIAFVGGGFHKAGIHNILEPAVYGVPVVFGPEYEKFTEARSLVALKYVFPVHDAGACRAVLHKLIADDEDRLTIGYAVKEFMKQNTGATAMIMDEINKEKWLL